MLSVTDLLTLSSKPAERDISLQIIQEFYKEHLCARLYTFELDDTDNPLVKLRFEEDQLCHLLGIQHVVKNLRNKRDYTGQSGYNKIVDGTLTFDFLKTTNRAWFKSKRNRMLYFPFTYQIVKNPNVILFSNEGLPTDVDFDIIFYNTLNNTYLHLGLKKDQNSDYYYPVSFYDRNKDDHINGQKPLLVKSIDIALD